MSYLASKLIPAVASWLLRKRPPRLPIPGTPGRAWLRENLAAAATGLSAEDMAYWGAAAFSCDWVKLRRPERNNWKPNGVLLKNPIC